MIARSMLSAVLLTCLATAATAQQNLPGALRHDGPRPGVAAWVATNPSTLQLTAAQLRSVQARMAQLERDLQPLRSQVQGLRTGRDYSAMSRSERHSVMMAAAAMRGGMLTLMDSADADVRAVLNPSQRQTLDAQATALGCPMNGGNAAAGCGMRGGRGMQRGGRGMQMGGRGMGMGPGRRL